MVTLELPVKVTDVVSDSDGVRTKIEQDLLDIQEAEYSVEPNHTETAHWFYRMPFPGVRFYSYGSGQRS